VSALARHVRLALRRLGATPSFTLASALTLSLTIGAITAAFAVADQLLLEPLPYPQSDRLVAVGYAVPGYGYPDLPFSIGTFYHTRQEQKAFSDFAIYYDSDRYNVGIEHPERIPVAQVTAGFFDVLRAPPALGRDFNEGDEEPGAAPVVIVSHDLWTRRYGADPGLVGRKIRVEGVDREVVGVAQAGFRYPDRETGLWIPLTIDPANLAPMMFGYPGVARLAPGVSIEGARADLARITSQLPDVFPDRLTHKWADTGHFHSYVQPLAQRVVGSVGAEVWLVVGMSLLLLVLAAANLANLFVIRLDGRARELTIRRALGARRRDLLTLPLFESLTLAGMGVVGGVALAALLLRLLVHLAPPGLPRIDEIGLGLHAVGFAVIAGVLTGLFLALFPASAVLRKERGTALRSAGAASTLNPGTRRVQSALEAYQAALAMLLLVGAGLLARSAEHLSAVKLGFRADGVFAFEIGLPAEGYDAGARARTWQQIADAIGEISSVKGVGGAEFLPFATDFRQGPLFVEGNEPTEGQSGPMVDIDRMTTGSGFFSALDVPLLRGRVFTRDDKDVVLVNQALVDQDLGGGPALGRRIRITNRGKYAEIIGVVGNMRAKSIRAEPSPYVYFPPGATTPTSPNVPQAMSFVVRSDTPPDRLFPLLEQAVARIDPKLPLGSPRRFTADVRAQLLRQDFVAWVVLGMAVIGLLLAAVGVYGVVAYAAAQRRKEVGVRIALGATPPGLLVHLAGSGLAAVAIGTAVGVPLALLGRKLVAGLLFGVSATDPATYVLAAVLLLGTAAVASLRPAWRASRMDASAVLREE